MPVRTGSRRLPGKNTRDFLGQPVFVYSLQHAREAAVFDEILVSTESEKVRDLCQDFDLELPFLRPEELASDTASLTDVLLHALDEYERRGIFFENVCMLWATAPMRTGEDILKAFWMLEGETEAVVGVTEYALPFFCALQAGENGFLGPMFDEYMMLPRDEHPSVVVDNGSMCWIKVSALKEHGTWLPPKLRGYPMPRERSVDIDTEQDWELAKFYYKQNFLPSGE